MQNKISDGVLNELIKELDIPESAYQKVETRYRDLGDWFRSPTSRCGKFDPSIYPQGSFRLGTVNRPLNEKEEYDLDVGCRLKKGVSKASHSQKDLKTLVGADMEDYRKARGIESPLEEMHRCWRLPYKDEMPFHLDGVPSIPEMENRIQLLTEEMVRAGAVRELAMNVARFAGSITDNRLPNYASVSPDWKISNSEGYALWFESRIKLAQGLVEKLLLEAKLSRVEDLPARKWKSPLQRVVQILKRHRDVMFADAPEGKPISIILTTLAAEAYRGEQGVETALERVLNDMDKYVRSTTPRVPNPVNPAEDFADKWSEPKYRHLNLESNFRQWLIQARADFQILNKSRDADFISRQTREKFRLSVAAENLQKVIGLAAPNIITEPTHHSIAAPAAKPWCPR